MTLLHQNRYYLDTSVSPSVVWLAAAVVATLGAYGIHLMLSVREGGVDLVAKALLRYSNGGEGTGGEVRNGRCFSRIIVFYFSDRCKWIMCRSLVLLRVACGWRR